MSVHTFVPVIGIIGGVGSGKSSIAQWLSDKHRIITVDGDQAGHEVLTFPSVKSQIKSRFSQSVFDDQGRVIRRALAGEIFGTNPHQHQARIDLERIVHSKIRGILETKVIEVKESSTTAEAVILDAAVLFEARWHDLCDAVVFVDTPYQQRLERIAESRGWSEDELAIRESSQMSLKEKRDRADFVVDNSGTLPNSGFQFEQILLQIKNQHG